MPEALAALDAADLGSLPAAYARLSAALADDDTDAAAIAEAVRVDPALTARLLRVVNSAAVAPRRPVDTVSHAAALVGRRALRELALAPWCTCSAGCQSTC